MSQLNTKELAKTVDKEADSFGRKQNHDSCDCRTEIRALRKDFKDFMESVNQKLSNVANSQTNVETNQVCIIN